MSTRYCIHCYHFGPEGGIVNFEVNFTKRLSADEAVADLNNHFANRGLDSTYDAYRAEALA